MLPQQLGLGDHLRVATFVVEVVAAGGRQGRDDLLAVRDLQPIVLKLQVSVTINKMFVILLFFKSLYCIL